MSAPIILVHGSTQSAAGFAGLRSDLERRGREVHLVDLPQPGPTTAATYADRIAGQLPPLDRPVVAAHSVSCLLLPAIADRLRARRQVWMAGAIADFAGRRSFAAEYGPDPTAVFHGEWIGADPVRDPVAATYFLFHDADFARLRAALATLAWSDLSAVHREVPSYDPRAVPSTYLLPTGDRTLRPEWMRRAARERLGVEPVELPGAHNLYAGQPEAVGAVLAALAE